MKLYKTSLLTLTLLYSYNLATAADAPPARKPTVLLVSDGNFFIEKALAAMELKQTKLMKLADFEVAQAKQFDLVIFDKHAPAIIPSVGSYIFINCVPPPTTPAFSVTDARPQTVQDVKIRSVVADHPLVRHTKNLSDIFVKSAAKLDVPVDWTVVAKCDQTALIAARRTDMLVQIVITFDPQQSNWPMKPSFPIFIHNAATWLAEPMADAR